MERASSWNLPKLDIRTANSLPPIDKQEFGSTSTWATTKGISPRQFEISSESENSSREVTPRTARGSRLVRSKAERSRDALQEAMGMTAANKLLAMQSADIDDDSQDEMYNNLSNLSIKSKFHSLPVDERKDTASRAGGEVLNSPVSKTIQAARGESHLKDRSYVHSGVGGSNSVNTSSSPKMAMRSPTHTFMVEQRQKQKLQNQESLGQRGNSMLKSSSGNVSPSLRLSSLSSDRSSVHADSSFSPSGNPSDTVSAVTASRGLELKHDGTGTTAPSPVHVTRINGVTLGGTKDDKGAGQQQTPAAGTINTGTAGEDGGVFAGAVAAGLDYRNNSGSGAGSLTSRNASATSRSAPRSTPRSSPRSTDSNKHTGTRESFFEPHPVTPRSKGESKSDSGSKSSTPVSGAAT